jgi:hypothetical protein
VHLWKTKCPTSAAAIGDLQLDITDFPRFHHNSSGTVVATNGCVMFAVDVRAHAKIEFLMIGSSPRVALPYIVNVLESFRPARLGAYARIAASAAVRAAGRVRRTAAEDMSIMLSQPTLIPVHIRTSRIGDGRSTSLRVARR